MSESVITLTILSGRLKKSNSEGEICYWDSKHSFKSHTMIRRKLFVCQTRLTSGKYGLPSSAVCFAYGQIKNFPRNKGQHSKGCIDCNICATGHVLPGKSSSPFLSDPYENKTTQASIRGYSCAKFGSNWLIQLLNKISAITCKTNHRIVPFTTIINFKVHSYLTGLLRLSNDHIFLWVVPLIKRRIR